MSAKTKKEENGKETFEQGLDRLEGIVRQLESGEKGLEDSIKLFEEGSVLSKQLTARLEEVKQKIDVLLKEGKDGFKTRPFEEN